jgi:hypothetical protein
MNTEKFDHLITVSLLIIAAFTFLYILNGISEESECISRVIIDKQIIVKSTGIEHVFIYNETLYYAVLEENVTVPISKLEYDLYNVSDTLPYRWLV